MSRIGKLPINIPSGVEVKLSSDNVLTVKGKLGELTQNIDSSIKVKIEDTVINFERTSDTPDNRSKHGLYRALVANMVHGVSEGFTLVQEVVGVGYKAENKGQMLELALGFSHSIVFEIPKEVKVEAVTEKRKNPIITLKSHDKQLLGQVAAKIRALRPPEPYKGKGIRFQGEELRKKAGKTAD